VSQTATVVLARPPRTGELTPGWRLVSSVTWIAVAVAFGSVWKTSDQLGLSTWWLGPRAEPQPLVVQILPFVPAALMVLAAINNIRRLPWLGLGASALVLAVGVADLGRVAGIAAVELVVAAAAIVVTVASFTGMLRPAPRAAVPATVPE